MYTCVEGAWRRDGGGGQLGRRGPEQRQEAGQRGAVSRGPHGRGRSRRGRGVAPLAIQILVTIILVAMIDN